GDAPRAAVAEEPSAAVGLRVFVEGDDGAVRALLPAPAAPHDGDEGDADVPGVRSVALGDGQLVEVLHQLAALGAHGDAVVGADGDARHVAETTAGGECLEQIDDGALALVEHDAVDPVARIERVLPRERGELSAARDVSAVPGGAQLSCEGEE